MAQTGKLAVGTLWRMAIFASLWWVLTEGADNAWGIGIPCTVVATYISLRMSRPEPLSLVEAVRLAPLFIGYSLRGAWKVARLAFTPRLPLSPRLIRYPIRLPQGRGRLLLINVASLLPGTLCVEVEESAVRLHVLDANIGYRDELVALERRIAALFRIPLQGNGGGARG